MMPIDENVQPVFAELELMAMASSLWLGCMIGHQSEWIRVLGSQSALASAAAVGIGSVAVGLVARTSPRVVAVAVVCGCAGLVVGVRAEREYQDVQPAVVESTAEVVSDPVRRGGGTTVLLRLDGTTRVEARAFGPVGHRLSQLSFGETAAVVGALDSIDDRTWLKARHIEGTMAVERVTLIAGPPWYLAIAAEVRSLVGAGSTRLPAALRPLYTGLVTGDDRAQGIGKRAVFREAGLGHLVAVSGQNVAFVLAVVGPLTRSLPRRLRLVFVLAVLTLFLLVTRMEPSVLRAVTCAGLSTWAVLTGRERTGVGILAAACAGLLLLDPFLAVVVGFQLSVVASLGILIVTPLLVERIPGPQVVVEPLAVTLGAQIAVSPLLVLYFDVMPLVALPANLVVGWAAGVVMMLGLTAGIAAGVLTRLGTTTVEDGGMVLLVADWLQLPTEILLRWIDWAARQAISFPLPRIDRVAVLVVVLTGSAWLIRPRFGRASRSIEAAVVAAAIALSIATTPSPPDSMVELEPGCLWLPGSQTLVLYRSCGPTVAEATIVARINSIDVAVIEGGSRSEAAIVALREVVDVRDVLAPPLHNVMDARRVVEPVDLRVASCRLADPGRRGCGELVIGVKPAVDRRRLSIDLSARS